MASRLKVYILLSVVGVRDAAAHMLRSASSANTLRSQGSASLEEADQFTCDDHLMLYALPKTGTTSFAASIRELCGWFVPYQGQPLDVYPWAIKPHVKHDVAEDYLRKLPDSSTVWVVSLVRNPFHRLLSDFYQLYWCRYGDDTTAAIQDFHQWLPYRFKKEVEHFFTAIKNTTGLDLLAHKMDTSQHMLITEGAFEGKSLKAVVLREEEINDWPRVLSPYMPGFKLVDANIASDGIYYNPYEKFASEMSFTQGEVDMVLQSEEFLFYSKSEIDDMVSSLRIKPGGVDFPGQNPTRGKHEICY